MAGTTDRLAGLLSSTGIKSPVQFATTGNIALAGEQVIDDVTVIEGMRGAVLHQDDPTQNGIYDVSTGDWTRSPDFSRSNDVLPGTMFFVYAGTQNGGGFFSVRGAAPIVFDTSAITFIKVFTAGAGIGDMLAANNLSDVLDAAVALANLGGVSAIDPVFAESPQVPDISIADQSLKAVNSNFVYQFMQAVIGGLMSRSANLSDVTSKETARANLGLAAAGTFAAAAATDIWAATSSTTVITPQAMAAALAEQPLVDGATVTLDLTKGINFGVTLGGNRALAAATITAALVNRSGRIRFTQDGTGGRTLNTTAAPFVNANGQDIILSAGAGAHDEVYYHVLSTSQILLSLSRNIA